MGKKCNIPFNEPGVFRGIIASEKKSYKEIPMVKKASDKDMVENYKQIKREVFVLLQNEGARIAIKAGGTESENKEESGFAKGKDEGQNVSY